MQLNHKICYINVQFISNFFSISMNLHSAWNVMYVRKICHISYNYLLFSIYYDHTFLCHINAASDYKSRYILQLQVIYFTDSIVIRILTIMMLYTISMRCAVRNPLKLYASKQSPAAACCVRLFYAGERIRPIKSSTSISILFNNLPL